MTTGKWVGRGLIVREKLGSLCPKSMLETREKSANIELDHTREKQQLRVRDRSDGMGNGWMACVPSTRIGGEREERRRMAAGRQQVDKIRKGEMGLGDGERLGQDSDCRVYSTYVGTYEGGIGGTGSVQTLAMLLGGWTGC